MTSDDPRAEGAEVASGVATDPVKRGRDGRRMSPASLANLVPGAGAGVAGNVRALRHAGHARQATLVRAGSWAERIYAELQAEAPLRDADGGLPVHDRQVVELLASALARLDAVTAWLDARPPVDEKGRPWPAEDAAGRLRRECARHLDALGMTPKARAALGLDLARTVDLAQMMSAQTAAEEAER